MDAICYICNKQTLNCHRNFNELKSQHTYTPICEFIKILLVDFDSVRNIYDESNRICGECLLQIDDYDWMKQQTIEQEAKLRHSLFTTEIQMKSGKNTPTGIVNGITDDSHNGLIFVEELENAEIEFEDSANAADMNIQQPLPPFSSISSSTLKYSTILAPQSNGESTFMAITKPKGEQCSLSIADFESDKMDKQMFRTNR